MTGEDGAHLGGKAFHPVQDLLPLAALCEVDPRVREFDRGKFQPLEPPFFCGDSKEERPVVTHPGLHRIIVDEISRIVEDGFAAVDLHPLEDVRTVPVIDVYTQIYDSTGEPAEDLPGPLYPVRAPVVGEYNRLYPHFAYGSGRPLYPKENDRSQGDRQVVRARQVGACRKWRLVGRERQQRHPARWVKRYGKDGGIRGFFPVAARTGEPNARRIQVLQGIEQPLFLEIHGVVVGQRTGVDPGRTQGLDGRGWGAEMEDFGRTGPRLFVTRNSALQVDDA